MTRAGKIREAIMAFSTVIDCHSGWAEAFFRRAVCYYLLGKGRLAENDLAAASLLGCREAQLWSRFDFQHIEDTDEE